MLSVLLPASLGRFQPCVRLLYELLFQQFVAGGSFFDPSTVVVSETAVHLTRTESPDGSETAALTSHRHLSRSLTERLNAT
jgi:hypothetical protein